MSVYYFIYDSSNVYKHSWIVDVNILLLMSTATNIARKNGLVQIEISECSSHKIIKLVDTNGPV